MEEELGRTGNLAPTIVEPLGTTASSNPQSVSRRLIGRMATRFQGGLPFPALGGLTKGRRVQRTDLAYESDGGWLKGIFGLLLSFRPFISELPLRDEAWDFDQGSLVARRNFGDSSDSWLDDETVIHANSRRKGRKRIFLLTGFSMVHSLLGLWSARLHVQGQHAGYQGLFQSIPPWPTTVIHWMSCHACQVLPMKPPPFILALLS